MKDFTGNIAGTLGNFGSDFTYVPYRVASVWFTDRELDSWERVR